VLSLVYLTNRAPSQIATELTLAGHTVWEALAVSEVLYLCEHENVDVVVIGPDVEDADVIEAQMRQITLRLKPGATAKDVMWELAQLFPSAVPTRGSVKRAATLSTLRPRAECGVALRLGVSSWYAGHIRRENRRHPRHWLALAELVGVGTGYGLTPQKRERHTLCTSEKFRFGST